MAGLNDVATIRTLDREGMGRLIHDFPKQCREGWEAGAAHDLPSDYKSIDKVVVAGMGGSAIAGDVLADVCAVEGGPLVTVHRDYGLPAWADDRTLVIFSSYSGGTEETLSCFREARARQVKGLAITSGGALASEARAAKMPVFPITLDSPPRAAFGLTFMLLTRICVRLGILRDKTEDVQDAAKVLAAMQPELALETPAERNPAKLTAHRLHGSIPVIISAGILRAAGVRWKNQLTENAKVWAVQETLPEMNHNTAAAAEAPLTLRENISGVLLYSSLLPGRVQTRYAATEELLRAHNIPMERVQARGGSALAHILSTVFYGDWVSFYLAAGYDIDPTPIGPINELKARLARD